MKNTVTKIAAIIFGVMMILLVFTSGYFVATLRQNRESEAAVVSAKNRTENDNPSEAISDEPSEQASTESATIAESSSDTVDDIEIPETATPEDAAPEDVAPVVSAFETNCRQLYADEIDNADETYITSSTYVASWHDNAHGEPYQIAHVVLADPSQLTTIGSDGNTTAASITANSQYAFAICASALQEDNRHFIDGLHIRDYTVIGGGSVVGTELAYTGDGELAMLPEGTAVSDLDITNIKWTILTKTPTLISNGAAVDFYHGASNKMAKSIIGMVSSCEFYFVTASDGDYLSKVTHDDIQAILLDKGCTFAQSLATGVNVVMAMNGKTLNLPAIPDARAQYEYLVVTDYKD